MKRISSLLTSLILLAATTVAAQDLSEATSNLTWREVGPTIMGGRVADIAVVDANPSTFYVGTATGGVWKTTNHGTSFEALFTDMPMSSIGDITLFQANPNLIWVGSGEPQNRQSSPWGNGAYKSTDGGRTWKHMGLTNTHHISRIQIHPSNPDVVYVAAMGHLWGQNPERGVFRTMDGGMTWEKVLFVDEMTGAIDLVMDPTDPQTLFAAMYQRQRTGFGYNGGGPSSGIYRTLDGGNSWQEMTEGLPENDKGRMGLSIYAKDPNVVFASVEARPGIGVYRSTDRGLTWEHMSETNNRPMYYSQIRVDPSDAERIYMGGSNLFRSSDGGRNFTSDAAAGVHSDHHALWIDPANSEHMILGGDGGVSVTWDRGEHWRQLRNLPLAQFYEVGVDNQWPYHVCGGLQDNGSWCAPNETLSNQGIRAKDWYNIGGGDGFYTVLDPENPDLMYGASQGGNIYLRNRKTWESQRMRPAPRPGENGETTQYRFNWNGPIVQSAHDLETVYLGGNHLFRSRDRGWTWEEASPDLTKNIDRETLEIMGKLLSQPLLSRNDGISSYGNITTIGESSVNADLIYVGTDDGNVQLTRDGGFSWTNVADRVDGVPDRTYVSSLIASRFAEGTVYATFDGHRNDDFGVYAYVSHDYGQNWDAITTGLPDGWSVNRIFEHPMRANLLFLGNEVGAYYSIDRGESWHRLNNNMPTVPVDAFAYQEREHDLVIGTHGRGIWVMDDITPLEEMSQPVLASAAHLFSVQTAVSYNVYRPQGWTPGVWVAENPEQGARIRYYVGADLSEVMTGGESQGSGPLGAEVAVVHGGVELVITDASGNHVRTLEGDDHLGVQEAIWDLRHEPPYVREEQPQQQFGGFGGGAPNGPKVMPGMYTVTMTAGGTTMSTEFEVKLDPRVEASQSDLVARQDAMMSAYALMKPQYEAGQAVRRVQQQLTQVSEMLGDDSPSEVRDEVGAIRRELADIQRSMGGGGGRRGGGGGFGSFEGWTGKPTADALYQLERNRERLPGAIERINAVVTERMPALNRMLDEHGVRPSAGQAIEIPRKP